MKIPGSAIFACRSIGAALYPIRATDGWNLNRVPAARRWQDASDIRVGTFLTTIKK